MTLDGTTIALISLVAGIIGSIGFHVVVVVGRFVRLEADVAFMMGFFRKLQEKSLELMIRTDQPEIDDLLNKYNDGEASEEDLRNLLYMIKQQHVQAIRHEEQLEKDPVRKISVGIFLAGIEAEYERVKRRKVYEQMTKWQRFMDFVRKII